MIKEVQTWLSEDELEAKRIEGMLRQRRIDYEAHGLLLSTAELNVILAQMDNPIINLSESQKRLLLYSAVAAGYKPRFLKFVDAVGITWLREAYQDSTLPYSVRKGAVMNLSILEDLEIFNELCKSATEATVNLWRSEPIELLAQYIHYSNRTFSLSFGLQKVVAPKVALLRIQDGSSQARSNAACIGHCCDNLRYHHVYLYLC
ncbi:MAG: hypothetical protein R2932_50515 [Caldilineaceae bacterium]